jgi:hypothetical protein
LVKADSDAAVVHEHQGSIRAHISGVVFSVDGSQQATPMHLFLFWKRRLLLSPVGFLFTFIVHYLRDMAVGSGWWSGLSLPAIETERQNMTGNP